MAPCTAVRPLGGRGRKTVTSHRHTTDPIQGFLSQTPVQQLLGHSSWDVKKAKQRIGKEGEFCSFRGYGQQATNPLKAEIFLYSQHLNKSKITGTSDITYHQVLFVTDPVLTWHSSQLNTAVYTATSAPHSLQSTGYLSKSRYREPLTVFRCPFTTHP